MIDKNAASHIHFGTQILGSNKDSWLNFIKLWSVYENIIYRFVYGDYLTARPDILKYAEPLASIFDEDYKILKKNNEDLNNIIFRISHKRNQAINFEHVKWTKCDSFFINNTIEFRCPNGTLNPVIWQNNVNLLARLLTYSKNTSYNDDLIEKRRKINSRKILSIEFYDEIYLEQALELCDIIFENNFDKIYFLKQYLKSFEINKKPNSYPKARKLVKSGLANIN